MSENNSKETDDRMFTPSVYTIILNYNNYSDTVETIESVLSLEYDNNSVLLVENSSDKSIIEKVRTRFPDIAVIENKKNLGYAGGNNIGILRAMADGAEYIFVLNNDITLEKDVLKKCVAAMETSPGCGACQPMIVMSGNREIVWSAGTQLYLGYPRLFQKETVLRKDGIKNPPFGLVGCAILFRKSALQQTGLFDESLFLLHEETDWCIRAKKLNFSLLVISDAIVSHKISTSIGMFSKLYLYYIGRNWLLVAHRNFPNFFYGYVLLTEFLIRFPYYLYHVTRNRQAGMIKFYLKGLFDGIRSISGQVEL